MGFSLGKVASMVGGGGAVAGMFGLPLAEAGMGLVAQKYGADLQGHELDKQAAYNKDLAVEMFNRQSVENQSVFQKNVAQEQAVFERNKAYANEMWDKEKAYNLELWNKQNIYNSPTAQMERMKAAGLNPRLMYGQGNVGNAVAVSTSHPQAVEMGAAELEAAKIGSPERGVVDRGELVMGALNHYMRSKQMGLMTAQLMNQTKLVGEQAEHLRIQNESDRWDLGIHKGSGVASDDNAIYKGFKRWFHDTYEAGKKVGTGAARAYDRWSHGDGFDTGSDWDGKIHLATDMESRPIPLNVVEPDFLR